jgi:uncharacterized protein YrrD
MLLAAKFIEHQIISLDEGRIIGLVKDFYIDQALTRITGLYLGSEGLIHRKPKLIRQKAIQLYGVEVLFVQNSGVVLEGTTLEELGEIDNWLRREDLKGRPIQSPTGSPIGQIEDIIFDEIGQISGFGLNKIQIKGPVAENQAIRREVMIEPGSQDEPMVIDLVKAEQQPWFFGGR